MFVVDIELSYSSDVCIFEVFGLLKASSHLVVDVGFLMTFGDS